jgi:hypothetical protein
MEIEQDEDVVSGLLLQSSNQNAKDATGRLNRSPISTDSIIEATTSETAHSARFLLFAPAGGGKTFFLKTVSALINSQAAENCLSNLPIAVYVRAGLLVRIHLFYH